MRPFPLVGVESEEEEERQNKMAKR